MGMSLNYFLKNYCLIVQSKQIANFIYSQIIFNSLMNLEASTNTMMKLVGRGFQPHI